MRVRTGAILSLFLLKLVILSVVLTGEVRKVGGGSGLLKFSERFGSIVGCQYIIVSLGSRAEVEISSIEEIDAYENRATATRRMAARSSSSSSFKS